jgi:hypothetical protein
VRIPALLLLLVSAVPVDAQQPLVVGGRVVATGDNVPLRRARIAVLVDGRTLAAVFADEEGRFDVTVPTSVYTLRITKSGYAPLDIPGSAQTRGAIAASLARAAVITGRVVDAAGQPAVGVSVRVRRLGTAAGTTAAEFHADTDDRGEYRVGHLAAGRYSVHSYQAGDPSMSFDDMPPEMAAVMRAARQERMRSAPPMSATATVEIGAGTEAEVTLVQNQPAVALPYAEVGGVVTGTLVDEFGEPAEDVTLRLWQTRFLDGRLVLAPAGQSRRADDAGRYRLFHVPAGRYLLVVTPDPEPLAGTVEPAPFLPVYFPGRLEVATASEVLVNRAQESASVDMVVQRARGARVHGTALDSAGNPLRGNVMLVPGQYSNAASPTAPSYRGNGLSLAPLTTMPSADGAFEVRNVPPGVYALQAVATIAESSVATFTINGVQRSGRKELIEDMAAMLRRITFIEGITEFALLRLTVNDQDIGPLALSTVPTSTISGRITIDGPGRLITPVDFGLAVSNVDPDEVPAVMMRRDVDIARDGTFRITGLTGRSRIVLTRAPAGWWLKSADIRGFNAATEPVDFGSPDDSRDDVTIVLADSGATLQGKVTGGANPQESSIVVFATDRALRMSGSRYVRTTVPDPEGRFSLNSFPPGQYFAIAVEAEDGDVAGDWESPERLDALARLAERVTLAEWENRLLDLRVMRIVR